MQIATYTKIDKLYQSDAMALRDVVFGVLLQGDLFKLADHGGDSYMKIYSPTNLNNAVNLDTGMSLTMLPTDMVKVLR